MQVRLQKAGPAGCVPCSRAPRLAQDRLASEVFTSIYVGLERLLKLYEVNTMKNGFFPAHLSKPLVIYAVKVKTTATNSVL